MPQSVGPSVVPFRTPSSHRADGGCRTPAPPAIRPPTLRTRADEGSLDHYLRDIGRFPLITREREAELARGIRAGNQEALDTLVRSNLRFVVSVARRYQHHGVSLSDLINEGNLGLIRGAHKFDATKGIKFISYAVWWIRQAILQALAEQSRIVRVPLNQASAMYRLNRRVNVLQQELGREATHAEIADGTKLRTADVARLAGIAQSALSLDAPRGMGDDTRLLDSLADEESQAPDERTFERALVDAVAESLASLKEREAMILRFYFGLDGDEPMTLEAIGARLGVTRERTRQIKEKALSRLRHAGHAQSLVSFFE